MRRLQEEHGSLPLALLATIVVTGLVSIVLASVASGQKQARFDADFEDALQVAEDGLDRAVVLVTSKARLSDFCVLNGTVYDGTAPECADPAPSTNGYKVDADFDETTRSWSIESSGADSSRTRVLQTRVEQDSLFQLAAFGKFFADFNGGNGADSYSSGTWSGGTFTEDTSVPLMCQGGPTGSPVTDVTAASQSDQYVCAPRKLNSGVVATNGRLKLKGQTTADTDAIEIHFARENVTDPLEGATGYCDGVPATCSEYPSGKLSYHRDPIELPDVSLDQCSSNEGAFPNATYGNTLPAGQVCFTDVTLDSDTVILGTPTDPTYILMSGTLRVPNGEAVNFDLTGAYPRPRPSGSLQIYSSDTGDSSLDFGNHAAISAVIYAPNAGFSGGAQGNVYGSLVAGSINNNGGWNFHYDAAAGQAPNLAPLVAADWVEAGT